jgi:ATP-dependent Zn protease
LTPSPKDYRIGAAIHEAGHAVVAWALGLPVGRMAIAIGGDDAKGTTEIANAERLSLVDQLAVCAAGMEAQELFKAPTHSLAAAADFGMMVELLDEQDDDTDVGLRLAGHEKARSLLKGHMDLVQHIATALVAQQTLTEEEVSKLLGDLSREHVTYPESPTRCP